MSRTNFQPTGAMKLDWRAFDAAVSDTSSGATLGGWDVNAAVVDLSDPAERRLGDYELIEELGRGGMGVVYRARQGSLDRQVALKLLAGTLWTRADAAQRFAAEAASAGRMRHPNIVPIHEFGTSGERCFYSMELVEGTDLAARLRAGPLPPVEAARLVRDLARAVHYAHSLNVLHLDLKPQNVLMEPDGRARIADFGLARPLDRAMSAEAATTLAGTPSYMAPEQALLRAAEISRTTDVYGLGAILYACLTGSAPFRGKSAEDTLRAVAEAPLAAPRSVRRAVSRDLEAVCLKCLQRDPSQRYASAEELAEDLGRVLDGNPVLARRLRWGERAWRWLAREPVTMGGLATAGALLVAAGAAWMLQFERTARTDRMAGDAFAATAQALSISAEPRLRLEALQQIVGSEYPFAARGTPESRFEFKKRLHAAIISRVGRQDPVARELALLLARDRRASDREAWRDALMQSHQPLAWLLAAQWSNGDGEKVLQSVQRAADAPAPGDMELALTANLCGSIREMAGPVRECARPTCDTVFARALEAAPRNPLFLLLQPEFDTAARKRWLDATQAAPLDDYGARIYRESLALLEDLAPRLAAEDLANGLTARDIAALGAADLLDWSFWRARVQVFEACRQLEHSLSEPNLDQCRRSLAAPQDGWTHWHHEAYRRAAQWRLDFASRGERLPKPFPRSYDYELRARLLQCCSQRGAHPQWVRLRSERGERAAEDWLFAELGESPWLEAPRPAGSPDAQGHRLESGL